MTKTRAASLVIVAAVAASAFDLSRPNSGDIRRFDPHEIARQETEMWRAYYDKRRLALFVELASMLRAQFGQPFLRSHVTAFHAARAAFIFKEGKARADYEKALPDLRAYYRDLLPASEPVARIAELELEWWIIHRERATAAPGALERVLADLQAAVYHIPPEAAAEHARLRAEAMLLRDAKAGQGGVTGADWARIAQLLDRSWTSLRSAVPY